MGEEIGRGEQPRVAKVKRVSILLGSRRTNTMEVDEGRDADGDDRSELRNESEWRRSTRGKKEYQARRELDQPAGVEPAAMTAECGCHETWVADQSRTAAVCAYTEGAECHQRSQGPPDSPSLAGLKCIRLA